MPSCVNAVILPGKYRLIAWELAGDGISRTGAENHRVRAITL